MQELDNPFWSSLQGRHRGISLQEGEAARFPPPFAPFLGVARAGVRVDTALDLLVEAGERVFLLGVLPQVPSGWALEPFRPLAQMTCAAPLEPVDGPEVIALAGAHREDVLALTALVYPHYFRPRTMELGRYFGIYREGRLAAMIGERLGTDGAQEVSAICTHPDSSGCGYARRLLAFLTNDILAQGRRPFLHVSRENVRALRLYERVGYRVRRDIGFWALERHS